MKKYDYFIKKSHFNVLILFALLDMIICALSMGIIYRDRDSVIYIALLDIFILILSMTFAKKISRFGLYIKDDDLYFVNFKCRKINVDEIKGIKISKTEVPLKYGFATLNEKYSAIYVNHTIPSMYECKNGDISFKTNYHDNIIFTTVYDEKLIEYLKQRNSSIQVF